MLKEFALPLFAAIALSGCAISIEEGNHHAGWDHHEASMLEQEMAELDEELKQVEVELRKAMRELDAEIEQAVDNKELELILRSARDKVEEAIHKIERVDTEDMHFVVIKDRSHGDKD